MTSRHSLIALPLLLAAATVHAQQAPSGHEEPLASLPPAEGMTSERPSRGERRERAERGEGGANAASERTDMTEGERAGDERARQPARQRQAPTSRDDKTVQQVTITAGRPGDLDERRASTASKLIYGREELDRTGDLSLGEILKRMPGVTVGGRPGRGGDIRMRGLGSGYTQILVNGERPPGGFSLDTLAPDQVERIEIYRAPVAEFSTRAIAGTINIVLREDVQLRNTIVRLADSVEGGRHAPNLSITRPGALGDVQVTFTLNAFQNRQRSEVARSETGRDAEGRIVLLQDEFDDSRRRGQAIQLTPRAVWRSEGGVDTVSVQPFLMVSRAESSGGSRLAQLIGPPAPYAASRWNNEGDSRAARLSGNWVHRYEDGSRLTLRLSGGKGASSSETLRLQYGADGLQRNLIQDTSEVDDHSAGTGIKYTTTVAGGHALTTGLDGEWSWREQVRSSLDNGRPQFFESGENLSARSQRLAAYLQDEWDIGSQWGASLGLRWEGIDTQSRRPAFTVSNRTSVVSPLAHLVWRIPGTRRDQVRLAATHSYRPPPLGDLVAVPSISNLNSPTRPDRQGNPGLKAELSNGLDLAFEHYFATGGIVSANIFRRDISNLIRRQTQLVEQASGTRWVNAPVNIGHARTTGLELEARFPLQEFFPGGPNVDVRSNASWFWSDVEGIPGPHNRLDQQPEKTANLGIDYRLASLPLTLGGNLNWTPAYLVQTSATQLYSAGMKRQFDLYGLWKFTPLIQLRVAANNMANRDYLTGNRIAQGGVDQSVMVTARTYTTWTARLELKL